MENSKVIFRSEDNQEIILDFTLQPTGDLDYKPSFNPKLTDPKKNLGLSGQLCEIFITALTTISKENTDNDKSKKLES